MFFDTLSHWKPLELDEGYHCWLPFRAAAAWPKITAGIFVDLANLLPENIRAQEINSKRFWRENWWLVAFGYSVCCRVSNVTKAQSVNANPSQSSWCTLFSSPWTSTTIRCFGLPAVSGFLDSCKHAVEFTVNSNFNRDVHIAVGDVQAESLVNSGSFRIYIKCSKMDSFC